MKKNYLSLTACLFAAAIWSCNDNNMHGSETKSDTTTTTSTTTDTSQAGTATAPVTPSTATSTMPLAKEDSTFVMDAAIGGMMEIEAGNLAQQNGANQRVKDFGAMMVRDHGQANTELKSLVSSRGVTIPDSLAADKRKHIESMRKMTGKSFDTHYISMMKDDHAKTISKFEKEAKNGKDADVKNWATKTLPVLKAHKDSIDAISKAKM